MNKPNSINTVLNRKILLWIALLLILLFYFNNIVENMFYQDDSFTTFRYVKNFLAGRGLVFNSGEYVEGYTNFFWVILLSALGKLGIDYVLFAQYLSVFFGALTLIVLYFITSSLVNSGKLYQGLISLIPSLLLSFNGGFIYWSVSAMETSLFLFLIFGAVYFFLNKENDIPNYLSPFFFLLASLTRPEGIFYFAIYFVFISVSRLLNGIEMKRFLSKSAKELSVFALPFLIYLIWKLTYYGDLLPNTFYAKTGFGVFYYNRGLRYIAEAFSSHYYFAVVFPPIFYTLVIFTKNRKSAFILIIIFANIINALIVGGDVLPLNRFLLIALPFSFVLTVFALKEIINKFSAKHSLVYAIAAAVMFSIFASFTYDKEKSKTAEWRSFELGLVRKMKIYAAWLNDIKWRENRTPVVALSTIGALSFYSDARVIDLIGLTDKFIAKHPKETPGIAGNISVLWKERRYNADYILARRPDFIIFPAGLKPSAYPEAALFSKNDFYFNYYPQLIYSGDLNLMLPVYTRKSGFMKNATRDICGKKCKIDFIENYIRASNYLLAMNKENQSHNLERISFYTQNALEECPARKDVPLALLGIANYHAGRKDQAEKLLVQAYEFNPYNSPALYYLMKVNFDSGNRKDGYLFLKKLRKISPDAFPGIAR